MKTENDYYIYNQTGTDLEKQRLSLLNDLYNPFTFNFLRPYLKSNIRILEIGCGLGLLAHKVLSAVDKSCTYVGIDRDANQIQHSREALADFQNATLIEADILKPLRAQLDNHGPFDLIYCRWVLVHLPNEGRVQAVRHILECLAPNGILLIEDCDNRSVEFTPRGPTQAPYKEATQIWKDIRDAFMKTLHTNYHYSGERLKALLTEAANNQGRVTIIGQYLLTLENPYKQAVIDGVYASADIIEKCYGKPLKNFVHIFEACGKDDNIVVPFLTQNVVVYRNTLDTSLFLKTKNKRGYAIHKLDEFSEKFVESAANCNSNESCLEIGAAYGFATIAALKTGAKIIANDIDSTHLEKIESDIPLEYKKNLQLLLGKFPQEINLPKNSIKHILLCRITHFLTPNEMDLGIKKLYDLLQPGGKIFLVSETPYGAMFKKFIPVYESNIQRMEKWPGFISELPKYMESFSQDNSEHMLLLGPDELKRAFEAQGFEIEDCRFFSRQGVFPEALCLDGREGVGLVARKP